MKKMFLVALMVLCGVSFSFANSFNDCVGDCMSSNLSMSKQKAVDATKCIGDCESAVLQDGLKEYQPELPKQQTTFDAELKNLKNLQQQQK